MALPDPPPREEVLRRLTVQAQRRLYAPGGGAVLDHAFLDLCLLEAWSEAHSITAAAFPQGLRNADDSIDPFVVGAVVDLCNAKAAGRHLNATDASGFAKASTAVMRPCATTILTFCTQPFVNSARAAKIDVLAMGGAPILCLDIIIAED